jgi:hypothetical protein
MANPGFIFGLISHMLYEKVKSFAKFDGSFYPNRGGETCLKL